MGVVFVSVSATDEMIDRVHEQPALIWLLYSPDDVDGYLAEIGANKKVGLLGKLFGKTEVIPPDPLPTFNYMSGQRLELDLDKSWDGINYCLKKLLDTGVINIFENGKKVGDVEVGYGPAKTFKSNKVRKLFRDYKDIDEQELSSALIPDEMKNVYPERLWQDWVIDDARKYMLEHYRAMMAYLKQVSEIGLGVIVVYT